MPEHRSTGAGVITSTFLLALVFVVVPMPDWARLLRPDLVALVLIYWCLATPERIGVGIGWAVGLLVDALTGTLLGQHALGMSVIAFATLTLYQRMRLFPLWQQAIIVFLLLATHQSLSLWVSGISGRPVHSSMYWLPSLAGMLLWPLMFLLLRRVRRHFRIG